MSVRATAIRIGATGSSAIFDDSKLEDMIAVIEGSLKSSPDSTVVADCVADLVSTYGASDVSDVTAPKNYKYVWDATTGSWVEICDETTTITVDDGEATDGRIRITVRDVYVP